MTAVQRISAVLALAAVPLLSAAFGCMAAAGCNTPWLHSRHLVPIVTALSTCKVVARIKGKKVDYVIDTGACTSAALSAFASLRRLNLDSLITRCSSKSRVLMAYSAGKGKVPQPGAALERA